MTNDAVNDSASTIGDPTVRKIGDHLTNAIAGQDVRQLVSELASHIAQAIGDASANMPDQHRHLRQLSALMAIQSAADDLAAAAAADAAAHGAMYPAIGDAAGMTRQAARVRWPGLARKTSRSAEEG